MSDEVTHSLYRDIFQDEEVVEYLKSQLRPGSETKGLEGLTSAQNKTKQILEAKKIPLQRNETTCLTNLLKQIAR